jgi:hypothetical protein
MVTRVRCARCAANAHAVPTWVLPRSVVRLGGAADQVGGFALLAKVPDDQLDGIPRNQV